MEFFDERSDHRSSGSTAELHYASDCGTKVQIFMRSAKKKTIEVILQFELLNIYFSNLFCKMSYTPNYKGQTKESIKLAMKAMAGQ